MVTFAPYSTVAITVSTAHQPVRTKDGGTEHAPEDVQNLSAVVPGRVNHWVRRAKQGDTAKGKVLFCVWPRMAAPAQSQHHEKLHVALDNAIECEVSNQPERQLYWLRCAKLAQDELWRRS